MLVHGALFRAYAKTRCRTYLSGMRLSILSVGFLLCGFCTPAFAQSSEYITNPSFEDTPRQNYPPEGWFDCSFHNESPIDVHGYESEFFGVKELPADGETFVGMVTRDNETYEGISTKVLQPLLADSTYEISIMVKQASAYNSISRATSRPVNYINPTLLEAWAGQLSCQMNTFLWEYKVEGYGNWDLVTFNLTPEKNIRYLSLYARHPENAEYTNGHILIDDLQISKVNPVTFERY